MMYLWLMPVVLFLLLLLLLFFKRTAGEVDMRNARERADVVGHGDEDR